MHRSNGRYRPITIRQLAITLTLKSVRYADASVAPIFPNAGSARVKIHFQRVPTVE